jgi:hypothetical protein
VKLRFDRRRRGACLQKLQKVNFRDSASLIDSLLQRIKRLEGSLEHRPGRLNEQPPSIPPSSTGSSPAQPETIETIDVLNRSTSRASRSGSPLPHTETYKAFFRPPVFVEGSRKRWGARSALGKACNPLEWSGDITETWVPAIDPKLQTIYRLGLPGADEPPKGIPSRPTLVLPDFPSPTYSLLLFEAYNAGVGIYYNIIHPVNFFSDLSAESVSPR